MTMSELTTVLPDSTRRLPSVVNKPLSVSVRSRDATARKLNTSRVASRSPISGNTPAAPSAHWAVGQAASRGHVHSPRLVQHHPTPSRNQTKQARNSLHHRNQSNDSRELEKKTSTSLPAVGCSGHKPTSSGAPNRRKGWGAVCKASFWAIRTATCNSPVALAHSSTSAGSSATMVVSDTESTRSLCAVSPTNPHPRAASLALFLSRSAGEAKCLCSTRCD
jgi:hypothetical protein